MYQQNSTMDIGESKVRESNFVTRVYGWMSFALAVTGLTAFYVVSNPELLKKLATNQLLFFGIIIAEIVLVIAMTAAINKVAYHTMLMMFIAYSVLNGLTFSLIFVIYTMTSIASTFFATAATFALMSCYGWYTKKDLTAMGSLCSMALIGIIVASIVNMFFASTTLYWVITYIGVLVFVGLIAYDTQKIKAMASHFAINSEEGKKSALMGALALYLDFINLFLMLLRIFGDRK